MHPHQYSWLRRKCKLKFLIQGNSGLNRCPCMPCNADNISHAYLSCKKLFCSITAVWNTFKSYWCGVVHDFPRQERRVYYLHLYKARKFPCKCVANIADGVDQHTTNIPSVRRLNEAMSPLTTVGTHLVGAIIHSRQAQNGKEIFGSFDYYQFPHDSNLTMTVLLDVLVYWADEYDLPLFYIYSLTTVWGKTRTGSCLPS